MTRLRTRDDDLAAFGHLTIGDLTLAASWCRTVEETHQVGRIGLMVHGPAPVVAPKDETTAAYGLWAFDRAIVARRQQLALLERTPEEQAVLDAKTEAQAENDRRILAARAAEGRYAHALDRANRGRHLMRHQKQLLGVT